MTRMRGVLTVTLLTALCSLVQARSVNKELLELNNHINTQFGFDYSNDEDFFSLIGVDAKSGESYSDSYSNQYYDFVPYRNYRKESGNEYDEDERNAEANEKGDGEKYILSENGGKMEKGRIIISEYEDSNEYDDNGLVNDYDRNEIDQVDVHLNLVKSEEETLEGKDMPNVKNNEEDNYVNDYDETHEIESGDDNSEDNGTEEEDEEEFDKDYDYEGDDEEEHNESYYDSGEDAEDNKEYDENSNENADYKGDYDYNETDDY